MEVAAAAAPGGRGAPVEGPNGGDKEPVAGTPRLRAVTAESGEGGLVSPCIEGVAADARSPNPASTCNPRTSTTVDLALVAAAAAPDAGCGVTGVGDGGEVASAPIPAETEGVGTAGEVKREVERGRVGGAVVPDGDGLGVRLGSSAGK